MKMKMKTCTKQALNNFSLHLKIEMIIFIISYQMYYTDFYYISLNEDIEHKVNVGFISWGCIDLAKKKKKTRILNVERFLIFV